MAELTKITTFLMFDDHAEEAIEFYTPALPQHPTD